MEYVTTYRLNNLLSKQALIFEKKKNIVYFNEIDDIRSLYVNQSKYNVKNSFLYPLFSYNTLCSFVIRGKGSNKNHLQIKVDSHVIQCFNPYISGRVRVVLKGV